MDNSNDEHFGVSSDSLEQERKPVDSKHTKKRLRRGSNLSLEIVWAQKQKQEKNEIKEAAKNARYARAFELQKKQIAVLERDDARKQFEFEKRIMLVDTSGMTDVQKQFYQYKKDEIIASRHHTSS